jgi:hypothetical protein
VKTSLAALTVLVLTNAFPQAVDAQYAPPGQPYIQIPISIPGIPGVAPPPRQEREYDRERWEHCERLREREHELRDRLAYAPPYSEERARLEHRLREAHYEREQCWRR